MLMKSEPKTICETWISVLFSRKFKVIVGGIVVLTMVGLIIAQLIPKPQPECKDFRPESNNYSAEAMFM